MWITFLEKGHVGIFHYDLIHKPIPILEVMKIPEATAAVNKEGGQVEEPTCLGLISVKPKAAVFHRLKRKTKTVHFAPSEEGKTCEQFTEI